MICEPVCDTRSIENTMKICNIFSGLPLLKKLGTTKGEGKLWIVRKNKNSMFHRLRVASYRLKGDKHIIELKPFVEKSLPPLFPEFWLYKDL